MIWRIEKKTLIGPLCSLFPLLQFLLFGTLFKIAHTNHALKVIYNMPALKKKLVIAVAHLFAIAQRE